MTARETRRRAQGRRHRPLGQLDPLFAPGAEEDRRVAMRFAARLHGDTAARLGFLRRMRTCAERQLEIPASGPAVERLAHRLERARTLTGERAVTIVVRAIASASRAEAASTA